MSNAILIPIIAAMAIWPFGRNKNDDEGTIRELEEVEVMVDTSQPISGSEQKAIESYREFLALASEDPLLRAEAMRRLADLQLETVEGEQLAAGLEVLSGEASSTVNLYEQLLESYPGYEKRDLVLYQLARAHEAAGRIEEALATLDQLVAEYPQTVHIDEAHFRRGEMLFVEQRYGEAEDAYAFVLEYGPESNFYEQSLYKQGWAQFKQVRHEDSLTPFFTLLDRRFEVDDAAPRDPADVYGEMGRAEQELVDDTLRVVSIGFSYMDGPESITEHFRDIGTRPYSYVVYTHLGDLYIDQERFQDAADAYRAFVELDPYHAKAPFMSVEVIEAFKQGGFADLVLEGKREFVEVYGPDSPYWAAFSYEEQPEVVAFLKTNLTDLAAYHHALAQESGSIEDYEQAARWYRSYLQSFPNEPESAGTNFLLAEVLFESERFGEAAREYERTAYAYPLHERSAEAGYAALLAFDEQEQLLEGPEHSQWHRQGIDSALRFYATYPEHEFAVAVQTNAAEKLFALGEFAPARDAANVVVTLLPPPDPGLLRTALTVSAHSEFDLGDFAAAESAYVQLNAMLPGEDPERGAIVERIASSIYKQGEQAQTAGLLDVAVEHFLRVGAAAPTSPIRSTAQYDAAATLIELQQWDRAAQVLEDFRTRYPEHEFTGDVTAKLAVTYVEAGQPDRAAGEFERIADTSADPDVQREALWRAGELYETTAQIASASTAYSRFVARFPDPVSQSIEARQKLADFAAKLGNSSERERWLTDIVAADATAGGERTDRTRYLAAHAQLELATPRRDAFRATRLVVPLQDSLAAKRARMEEALEAYGNAADYGVIEVTTAATYEIAELYHMLSRDLFDSERPPELSAAELAQYDILLEEQAFPFEEEAIDVHEVNARRTADGVYDEWVRRSLESLGELLPVRYAKHEVGEQIVTALR
jgi:tetratricopeptide (TPR) repeat protein